MSHDPLTIPPERRERTQIRRERLLRPLLQQMMARAYGFRNTPLQFEIDSVGIAVAAWNSFWADVAAADAMLLSNGERTCAALDGLIEQALDDGGARGEIASGQTDAGQAGEHEAPPGGVVAAGDQLRQIAQWLDRLCASLRGVDARAIEVVGLRVEGYTPRDIAQRLGTGLRLVQRLLADVRAQRGQSPQSG